MFLWRISRHSLGYFITRATQSIEHRKVTHSLMGIQRRVGCPRASQETAAVVRIVVGITIVFEAAILIGGCPASHPFLASSNNAVNVDDAPVQTSLVLLFKVGCLNSRQ